MKKSGGGLGFVILILALVIVLLLSARAWNAIMPVAAQALRPGAAGAVPDHGQSGAGEAIRSGTLPNLKQMNQNTDQHIQQMKDSAKGQD
jgi:hypothetical protein